MGLNHIGLEKKNLIFSDVDQTELFT